LDPSKFCKTENLSPAHEHVQAQLNYLQTQEKESAKEGKKPFELCVAELSAEATLLILCFTSHTSLFNLVF